LLNQRAHRCLLLLVAAGTFSAGCQSGSAPSSSEPRLGPIGRVERRTSPEPAKPLPSADNGELPPPPFADVPLVYQRPPEQKMFLDGYNAVGRPRLAVFVNRSLLGDSLPITAPPVGERLPPTGADPIQGNPFRDESGRPVEYLGAGQYDEAYAKQIDYITIENVMTQWLACEGQTTIASPSVIRERLTAEEINKLQAGRPRMLGEVAKELNADVLVYAQARPTRQTEHGLEIRLNAEAINISSGEQIARATVLIPPPLDTEQVNQYTRFIARKLMADMAMTWAGPGPARRAGVQAAPAPSDSRPLPIEPAPRIDAPLTPPAINEPAPPTSTPPVTPRPPALEPKPVPQEKPSLLDRPDPSSVSRTPDDDLPPPPASAGRRPD